MKSIQAGTMSLAKMFPGMSKDEFNSRMEKLGDLPPWAKLMLEMAH